VGEKISAGCGLYGTGGCGEHGWTEQSRRARLLAALALAPFGAAPLVARSKPNFHRNNDRKPECELQGCVHCGLSRIFACGSARLGEKSAERKQVVCGFFYVVAALQSLRVKSHDPQRIVSGT
jgi:hypothetical protein